MLERDIVAAIKRYLRTLGDDVFFWKESGGPYGTSGVLLSAATRDGFWGWKPSCLEVS